MTIEERVRELCKIKGIKLSELANKVGIGQSNMIASIRKNPRISTLEEIAIALGVKVADLIDIQKTETKGVIILNGKTFIISEVVPEVVQVPVYSNYSPLRSVIKGFVKKSIDLGKDDAICGYVETMQLFSISYDSDNKTFTVVLCYGKGHVWSRCYPCLEYGDGNKWDLIEVVKTILYDIEGIVPTILGYNPENLTQADIDKAVSKSHNK